MTRREKYYTIRAESDEEMFPEREYNQREKGRDSSVINYIFFDLDGTLSDSAPGIIRCVKLALRDLGFPEYPPETYRRMVGPPLQEGFMSCFGMSKVQAEECVMAYRSYYTETALKEHAMYSGVPAMVWDLRCRGKRMGIATTKPRVYAVQILNDYRIAPYFDIIMGPNLNGSVPPHPTKKSVLLHAMAGMGLRQEQLPECLMVGDRRYDVEGARDMTIDFVGAGYGYAEPGELEAAGAEVICPDVEALHKYLVRL